MNLSSLGAFCSWLALTPLSVAVQTTSIVVPAVQTVHILCIAAVVSAALLLTLHALGVVATDQPSKAMARRFLPLIWWGLPVLAASGAVLIVAEPARSLENPIFYWKMGLLTLAVFLTLAYQLPQVRRPDFWTASPVRRGYRKALAVGTLLVWFGVVFAGRWIAYFQSS